VRIWKAVEEAASGDATLNPSAAEMNLAGAMTEEMRKNNAQYVNEQTRMDQEVAQMLVNARQGFFRPNRPSG
jgi:hypothetical protein